MSNRDESDHLANLSDGAGCAEVWEHLSEQREAAAAAEESDDDPESTDADNTAEETATESDDAPEQDATAVPCP